MPTDINRNIVAVSGPRDAEWQLLESLRSAHASGPGQLKPGVLVITASGALRRRLARRIAEDRNGAVLGIEVTTLSTVVGRLLAREADVEQPTEWFELIVRRALADQLKNLEPPLAFDDAAGSLVSSVRDLISAGLEPELADDLAQLAASPNAAIVVKAAASCLRELRRLHVGRNSERMRRATEILRDSGHQVLNDRRVFILGFADAPGRTTAFLRGLIEITDARLLLEMPQSFGRGSEQAVRALPGRFARNLGFADLPTPPSAERWPALAAFDASGRSATARELMWRLRETIDAGRRPEDIVVGLRGMETWA
ncbi:MAG: hypothetical protein KDB53_15370, partial [Planctomycetes bacterium]|nr:hypothetical protein [Planctomycetota bacterium]